MTDKQKTDNPETFDNGCDRKTDLFNITKRCWVLSISS